jgi:hypothetical protein
LKNLLSVNVSQKQLWLKGFEFAAECASRDRMSPDVGLTLGFVVAHIRANTSVQSAAHTQKRDSVNKLQKEG